MSLTAPVAAIPDRPISFEVFSDEFEEMERQAREIATWAEHVYVKIPVTNTQRLPAYDLIHRLSHTGVKVNVTAIMTLDQVREVMNAVKGGAPSNVSVFAGRIADTGRDPVPLMRAKLSASFAMSRTPSSSGRARASCSTSSRPTPSAATSSPSRTTSSRSLLLWGRASTSIPWRQ